MAKTIHSHYGLQTAELPAQMLIKRSLERQNVLEQVENTEVLIWDEMSMSSQRLLNLVNMIHKITSQNTLPFGGVQVVLVGDFWQLKPIPSSLDAGIPIYESKLFNDVFPHRFELTRILRQEESEHRLIEALDVLRMGRCDDETEKYLRSLSREFDSCEDVQPVHIYFKRLPVEVHNLSILAALPGSKLTFESTDTGNAQLLNNTVPAVLYLKPGCKVMLLYNVSNQLKNGICGQFVGVDVGEDGLLVRFPKVGTVTLRRKTWFKYDSTGRTQGSRSQYPLALCYAITAHKAQSLTMDKIVVHCSQEFIPGQTYVAISRVRREESLQILGFHQRFLLPPPSALTRVVTCQSGNPVSTFDCCKNSQLDESLTKVDEERQCPSDREDDPCEYDMCAEYETIAKQHFESNVGVSVNLENVLFCMSDFSHELSHPPVGFTVKDFLSSLLGDKNHDPFTESIKAAANYAIDDENLDSFELLACILWHRINDVFQIYLTENLEEVHMTNKNFTCATAKVNQLFITNEYRSDVISAFKVAQWSDINSGQRSLAVQLMFHLYELFTAEVGKRVKKQEEEEPICFNVADMEASGLGKIRYIGGWAIRKSMDKSRRYVVGNKSSDSTEVLSKVSREIKKVNLLENNVIVPFVTLEQTTTTPETLDTIEERQFRERGLLHISDGAYAFFLQLEQERVNKINLRRLTSLKSDLIDSSMKEVSNNITLKDEFTKLFDLETTEDQVIINV
jgi:ATP-dependent DNA helicase PIF1